MTKHKHHSNLSRRPGYPAQTLLSVALGVSNSSSLSLRRLSPQAISGNYPRFRLSRQSPLFQRGFS